MSQGSTPVPDLSYESAICALNSLQTNAQTLLKIRREPQKNAHQSLPLTRTYLERSGVSLEELDSIKIIHVSGTKGKGSTCAFCESILREHGLRTGFYSSPHLVSATERIRLDGQPIQKEKFAEYFWDVFDKVCRGRDPEDRPPYFQFLTILAFNVFLKERVDVAVVEVGIGGEFDSTNVIRKPVVTGITALGLDHTNILGNTISQIAWHKAGIMKPGAAAYIDGEQLTDALKVISGRSAERGPSAVVSVPSLKEYHWGRYPRILGLFGEVQNRNASLALALSRHCLASLGMEQFPETEDGCSPHHNIKIMKPFKITANYALGLRLTDWPGRNQLIDQGRVIYMLDGAHTEESVHACRTWFTAASKVAVKRPTDRVFKVMLFNTTGDRDPWVLLRPFVNSGIDMVIFCTNISGNSGKVDQENFTTTEKIQMARCEEHLHAWTKLQSRGRTLSPPSALPPVVSPDSSPLSSFINNNPIGFIPGIIIPTISEALAWISQSPEDHTQSLGDHTQSLGDQIMQSHSYTEELLDAEQVQVLVTGSIHLVGGVLALIQPDGLPAKKVDTQMISEYRKLKVQNGFSSVPGMM